MGVYDEHVHRLLKKSLNYLRTSMYGQNGKKSLEDVRMYWPHTGP